MLPVLELVRLEENAGFGTFGVLKINKEVFCVTLEPPDLLNAVNVSLIPAQQYLCKRIVSPTFGETFLIMDVPGRTDVMFHPGNVLRNTRGCPLLAQHYGKLHGDRAVLNSGDTFKAFMARLSGHDLAHLTIQEHY